MRDALSLLDQVIAFGGSNVTAQDTRAMLGTIEQTHVVELLDALAARDAKRLLACVADLDERVPDYQSVLAEMAAFLQRAALFQAVPDMQLDEADDTEALRRVSAALTPEDVQLCYQIAL